MREELARPNRDLSDFVAHELLLDYCEGRLDSDRHKAIEKMIKENPEIKEKVMQMKSALDFCQSLSALQFSEKFLHESASHKGRIHGVLHRLSWSSWPDSLRWSSEAFLISCFVALLFFATPWGEILESRKIFQTRLLTSSKTSVVPKVQPVGAPAVQVVEKEPEAKRPEPTQAAPIVAAAPSPTQAPQPTTKPKPKAATTSYLHRVIMKSANIKAKTPALVAKLKQMGAAKAGQVEIGWRKENGNYFHFTIPDQNYNELIKLLSQYGAVRVYKNPHPRVLAENTMRFIVWIEDRPTDNEESQVDEAESLDSPDGASQGGTQPGDAKSDAKSGESESLNED